MPGFGRTPRGAAPSGCGAATCLPRVRPVSGAALPEVTAGEAPRDSPASLSRCGDTGTRGGTSGERPGSPPRPRLGAGRGGRRLTGGTGRAAGGFGVLSLSPFLPTHKARSRPSRSKVFLAAPRSAAGGAPLPDRSRRKVGGGAERSPPLPAPGEPPPRGRTPVCRPPSRQKAEEKR